MTTISLVPCGVLTDEVFLFNQDNFREILDLQSKDLGFLASPPVRAIVDTDSTGVIRGHMNFSNTVRDSLPGAFKQLDDTIHALVSELGAPGQGNSIISSLQDRATVVVSALVNLDHVLTQNNLLENLQIGQDKYNSIQLPGTSQIFLGPIADLLPKILASIATVRAAFETLQGNLKAVKVKINTGITDPKLIFAEPNEVVEDAWKHYEVQRKTMTYLPYHY